MRKLFYAAFLITMFSQVMFAGRYYDARTGRFLQVDPQSHQLPNLSPYAYCENNPIKNIDPDGNFSLPANSIKSPSQRMNELASTIQNVATAISHFNVLGSIKEFQSAVGQTFGLMTNPTGTESLLPDVAVISVSGGKTAAKIAAGIESSTVAETSTSTATSAVAQPNPGGQFVVDGSGNAVKIPQGYTAAAAKNGKGIIYRPEGSTGDANTIRIMEPNAKNPTGYARVYNSKGQPINPTSGQPEANAETHVPLNLEK